MLSLLCKPSSPWWLRLSARDAAGCVCFKELVAEKSFNFIDIISHVLRIDFSWGQIFQNALECAALLLEQGKRNRLFR